MTETRRDITWTPVFRVEDTDNWFEWSTGHRGVSAAIRAAEVLAKLPVVEEIRFERVTVQRDRFSLAELAAADEEQPPADRAAWVDGDPLMEAIAAAVWDGCRTEGTMSLIVDDPRNIAAVAATVTRAAASAVVAPPTDRAGWAEAAVERVRAVLETEAVVGRSALDYRGLIASALMAVEAHDTGTQQQPDTEAPEADRPTVLREIATTLDQLAETDVIRKRRSLATARRLLAVELRRMADEPAPVAQQPAGPPA